jgi:sec-independent protein translocase protein TatA
MLDITPEAPTRQQPVPQAAEEVNLMFGLGMNEILIVGGILVVLFGGAKIALLGKGLGQGIREFRASLSPVTSENETSLAPAPSSPAPVSVEKVEETSTVIRATR